MRTSHKNLTRLLPIACVAIFALISLTSWVDESWHPEWDGAIYLLTAESLARGDGYTYQGQPFFLRPPGMSWLLSLFVDADGFDPERINRLLTAFAAAAVGAIAWAVAAIHGSSRAALVALLAGTSTIFTGALNAVLSEFPFLFTFFLGIAAATHALRTERSPWAWLLLTAIAWSAALYLRTVAVLVLPGLVILGWRRRSLRIASLLTVSLVAGLAVPWLQHAKEKAAEAEVPAEQLFLHDYGTAMFRVDPGDPSSELVDVAGWTKRIQKNGTEAWDDLAGLVWLNGSLAGRIAFLLLCLAGYVAAWKRGPTLFEWLAPVYLLLVLTYFTYALRLTAPLVPLVYLYTLLAVEGLASLAFARIARAKGPLAVRTCWIAGLGLLWVNSSQLELPAPLPPAKQDQLTIAEWIRENTPADATFMCNQAPVYELLTGRRFFTFRFLRRLNLLQRYPLDYVLFDQPQKELMQAMRQGPTEREIIHTPLGSRIPIFRIRR